MKSAKKKDLMELLEFVPLIYHTFYQELVGKGTEDSEDESEHEDSESEENEQSDQDSDWVTRTKCTTTAILLYCALTHILVVSLSN